MKTGLTARFSFLPAVEAAFLQSAEFCHGRHNMPSFPPVRNKASAAAAAAAAAAANTTRV
jgi:hypothetical protein